MIGVTALEDDSVLMRVSISLILTLDEKSPIASAIFRTLCAVIVAGTFATFTAVVYVSASTLKIGTEKSLKPANILLIDLCGKMPPVSKIPEIFG